MAQYRPSVFETNHLPPSDLCPKAYVRLQRPVFHSGCNLQDWFRDLLAVLIESIRVVNTQEEKKQCAFNQRSYKYSYVLRMVLFFGLGRTVYLKGSYQIVYPYMVLVLHLLHQMCTKQAQAKDVMSTGLADHDYHGPSLYPGLPRSSTSVRVFYLDHFRFPLFLFSSDWMARMSQLAFIDVCFCSSCIWRVSFSDAFGVCASTDGPFSPSLLSLDVSTSCSALHLCRSRWCVSALQWFKVFRNSVHAAYYGWLFLFHLPYCYCWLAVAFPCIPTDLATDLGWSLVQSLLLLLNVVSTGCSVSSIEHWPGLESGNFAMKVKLYSSKVGFGKTVGHQRAQVGSSCWSRWVSWQCTTK